MNTLKNIFYNQLSLPSIKWEPYFEIYETHMQKWCNAPVTLVEVGVMGGGSLEMWKTYLGSQAEIYGIDIEQSVLDIHIPGVTTIVGDQGNQEFWQQFLQKVPSIDIFVDDGSHQQQHQLLTFQQVWPHIRDQGIYICEDCHTCYWKEYGGALGGNTFVEMSKAVVDFMNRQHLREPILNPDFLQIVHDVQSVTFYDSVIVFKKGRQAMRWAETKGSSTQSSAKPAS